MTDRILGLIPAKGASQRLPRKNLADLGGRPLIQWAADSASKSGICARVILSTEDELVARQASELGIEVPFVRPDKLARDPAGVVEVALHALEELEKTGERYDTLIILLPSCPFRSAADIKAAYDLFLRRERPCVMSVSQFDHTPFAALECGEDDRLSAIFPEHLGKKSQDMPPVYRPNGAIHVLDVERFKAQRSYFFEPLIGYVMPQERSIDIDNELDLTIARSLLSLRRELGE